MRAPYFTILWYIAVCVVCVGHASSQDLFEYASGDGTEIPISITVWGIDLHPKPTITDAELLERLHERARIGISSMLYGYSFHYTLQNRARGIRERFRIDPIDEIAVDDPGLRLVDSWKEGEMLYGRFLYRAHHAQSIRFRAWQQSPVVEASGSGRIKIWTAEDEQQEALTIALKEGIIRHLRATHRNKPRAVAGKILVRKRGPIYIRSGEYHAHLSFSLRVDEIEEFRIF